MDLDILPNSQSVNITIGRVACMIVYLMEEVLDVFVRKEHFQLYPDLMSHKMRLLENVSEQYDYPDTNIQRVVRNNLRFQTCMQEATNVL